MTDVNNARTAMRFFGLAASDFSGHAQCGFNGHANLQRRGRCKIESALRNVERFREMLALISSEAHGLETNWRPHRITGQLASFRHVHTKLLRAGREIAARYSCGGVS